ncbi:MAG: NB-ARC domain-containing protein [Patescibacteria group bacterium]
MKKFGELFKKYRLRAEFETFPSFGEALYEKGYHLESSIFSRWQNNSRLPTSRQLILTIIGIFVEKRAITTIHQANEFLAAAGHGYMTEEEKATFSFPQDPIVPFQVPHEIANFIGREKLITEIKKDITSGKIIILHGPPGIGKTALAIRLGHLLRSAYPDGVLWYKVDSSNVIDILLSLARLFGEDIRAIKDLAVRASVVRTLLEHKKLLLIFDNVSSKDKAQIYALLPNTRTCGVIFSSREQKLAIASPTGFFAVKPFDALDVLSLFQQILGRYYVVKHKKEIVTIGEKLGNLPLAVHLVATNVRQHKLRLQEYIDQLNTDSFDLTSLNYEDRNLARAITMSYDGLTHEAKEIFVSLGVFEGKDFSLEAVAFVNKLSLRKIELLLQELSNLSLIEQSQSHRYRIHPLLRSFAREQMKTSSPYLQAAFYYEQLLNEADQKNSYNPLTHEVDNIIYIFKKCYDLGYWDQVITLWNPIEKFLSDINETKKLKSLTQTIDTAPSVNNLQKIMTVYMLFLFLYWILLSLSGLKTGFWNYSSSLLNSFIPLIGGLVGIFGSRHWGMFNTNIGKAILFISIGLSCWGSGNIVWGYYNFFAKIDIPYPSFSDIGYLSASIFWIFGSIYLSRATGAKFSLKAKKNKLFLLLIPFLIISFSCYILFFVIKQGIILEPPLKMFFDLAYPVGDVIILTLAVIIFGLSVNFFRRKYRLSLFMILTGFVGMYISDFMFSYTTSIGIYYNGSFTEFMFCISLFFITWGTLSFYLTPKKK